MSYSNVKSVIIDIADSWNAYGYFMGIRSIEFYNNETLYSLTSSDYTAYATSSLVDSYEGYAANAFNTTLSKTGTMHNTQWVSEWTVSSQRLICVFNSAITISKIITNNGHNYGSEVDQGIKNVKVYFSTDSITDTTYNAIISNSSLVFDGQIPIHVNYSDVVDDQTITLISNTNIYIPPVGDNIQFVFTGSYTAPAGDSIVFDFANQILSNNADFIFEEAGYISPSYNNIEFWFLPSTNISLSSNIITSSSLNYVIAASINSFILTYNSLTPKSDIVISIPASLLISNGYSNYGTNSQVIISIPDSLINTTGNLYYGQDKIFNIIPASINLTSQLIPAYDITLTLPSSIITINNSILPAIKTTIISNINTSSNIYYAENLQSNFIYFNTIGLIASNNEYLTTIQGTFNVDYEYINGLDLQSTNEYNCSFELTSDIIIINEIISSITNQFNYQNTILDVIKSTFDYLINMYIINDNLYKNDIVEIIISNNELLNRLDDVIESNFEYGNTSWINNINNYHIDLLSNVIANIQYSNNLSEIINSNHNYKNGIYILSDLEYTNSIDIIIYKQNTIVNDFTLFITSGLNISNDLNLKNLLVSNNKLTNYLSDDSTIIINNEIDAYIDNQPIELINCNISINADSFAYSMTAEVANLEYWMLCNSQSEIIIYLNSNEYRFLIDSRTRTREFNSDVLSIDGRSKTSILESTEITKTWDSIFTQQAIEEICVQNNIQVSYNMLNWNLDSGILTADKATAISIMQKVVEAAGGIIICNNLGDLYIEPKYPKSPIDYDSYVDRFNDFNNIFSISESKEINPNWNAVTVSNIEESQDYSYNILEIETIDIYTKQIRVKVFPFLEQIDLLTSFISNGIVINSYDNPIEETITDEIVEIIEGKGSTSESIKQVVSYEYLNTNLGTLLFNNNEITTQIAGESLIKISYITEYHDFLLYNNITTDIQVYTTDLYEVV